MEQRATTKKNSQPRLGPTLSRGLFTTGNAEWHTPKDLLKSLHEEFGPLWDPCPGGTMDGLIIPWKRHVFCNPPYGRVLPAWLKKGAFEMDAGHTNLIVWLLPARTDPKWFHEIVFPRHSEIRFLRGRLHFNDSGPAPFLSMVVVWRVGPATEGSGQQRPRARGSSNRPTPKESIPKVGRRA